MPRTRTHILVFALLLFCTTLFAQTEGNKPKAKFFSTNKDTQYVVSYKDDLIVRGFLLGNSNAFRFGLGENNYIYQSNVPIKLGLGFSYRWLDLNVSFLKIAVLNDKQFSKFLGFTSKFFLNDHLFVDVRGDISVGYSLKGKLAGNTLDVFRDNLWFVELYLSAYYFFNGEKYSHKSITTFSERQIKSAGGFFVGLGVGLVATTSNHILTPTNTTELETTYANLITRSRYVGPLFGYAYNFVHGSFYFNVKPSLSPSLYFGEHSPVTLGMGIGLDFAFGWDIGRFRIGLFSNGTGALSLATSETQVKNNIFSSFGESKLMLAYRLDGKKLFSRFGKPKP